MSPEASLTSFLFIPQNLPFAVALGLMVVIGALEGTALALGGGMSGLLDQHLPDFDGDVGLDGHVDAHALGWFERVLGWLHLGRVPALVVLVLFLCFFGLFGLLFQYSLVQTTGWLLPGVLASVPAFFAALPLVRVCAGGIAKVLPKDETEAVTRDSFVGRVALVIGGPSRSGTPTQAKLRDEHGYTHYVLVEPDVEGLEFLNGDEVVLVRQASARFYAIKNTCEALSLRALDATP